jgi:membrane protease YdiL (CAAX protease family)
MVRWRVRPVWYAAALLLSVGIALSATLLNVLLGARPPSSAELGAWPGLVPTFFLLLLVPGIGGAWEEPGWRGYALPYLQAGRSALVASLVLGVVWAFWHLPLMVYGTVPWSDIAYVVVQTVVYTWLFNSTGGSVLLVMLFTP